MSKLERIRFSLNLSKPEHIKVWEMLGQYHGKQRSNYIVACILSAVDADHLEKIIGRVLDERLRSGQLSALPASAPVSSVPEDGIPASILGLLDEF